jgi:hypothetical protein
MNPPPPAYQRLPGTGYRRLAPGWVIVLLFFVIGIFALLLRGRRVRLYLGEDHLLSVEWDGGKEYYKRFRYADIQALTVRRTLDGRTFNIVAGGLTVLLSVLALLVGADAGAMTFFLVLAAVALLILIGNLISGPTCQVHLRTAVQVEELVSLGRLKHAESALSRLRERIIATQGAVPAAEIAVRLQQLQAVAAARFVVDDPNAPPRML